MSDGESILQDLRRSVETWDDELMHTSVDKALDMGMEPKMIVTEGLAKGMDAISDLFNDGKIFLPQVLAASNTMDNNAVAVGTSALMTSTMVNQKTFEEMMKKEGLKGKCLTNVGGAPVTQQWADEIGADVYTETSSDIAPKMIAALDG